MDQRMCVVYVSTLYLAAVSATIAWYQEAALSACEPTTTAVDPNILAPDKYRFTTTNPGEKVGSHASWSSILYHRRVRFGNVTSNVDGHCKFIQL